MKIGDKVKCLTNAGSNSLIFGNNYEIVDINVYGNIQVEETSGSRQTLAHFYKPERFLLLKNTKNNIDLNKTYKTRGGNAVNLLGVSNDRVFPIVGETLSEGEWSNASWTMKGEYLVGEEGDEDLIEYQNKIVVDCSEFEVEIYDDRSVHLVRKNADSSNMVLDASEMKGIVSAWSRFN